MRDCALVVVDMLYDFIDGSMACLGAGQAIESTVDFIQKTIGDPPKGEDVIYGSFPILFVRDSHPANHCSFTEYGGPWPAHCIKDTKGAQIHSALSDYVNEELCFYKGCDPDKEQYSGFAGENEAGQSLGEVLSILDIKNVYVCGIATEYCVRNTCEDLLKAGFNVLLLPSCLAYVSEDGHQEALKAMEGEGIKVL